MQTSIQNSNESNEKDTPKKRADEIKREHEKLEGESISQRESDIPKKASNSIFGYVEGIKKDWDEGKKGKAVLKGAMVAGGTYLLFKGITWLAKSVGKAFDGIGENGIWGWIKKEIKEVKAGTIAAIVGTMLGIVGLATYKDQIVAKITDLINGGSLTLSELKDAVLKGKDSFLKFIKEKIGFEIPENLKTPLKILTGVIGTFAGFKILKGIFGTHGVDLASPTGILKLATSGPLKLALGVGKVAGIGAVILGIGTLYQHLTANPAEASSMPQDPTEQKAWWHKLLKTCGLEHIAEKVVALIMGEKKAHEMFVDEDDGDKKEEVDKYGERVSYKEIFEGFEADIQTFGREIFNFILNNKVILGILALSNDTVRSIISGTTKITGEILLKILKLPLKGIEYIGKHKFKTILIVSAIILMAKEANKGADLKVPKDKEKLKLWVKDNIHEKYSKLDDKVDGIKIPEPETIDYAVDFILEPTDMQKLKDKAKDIGTSIATSVISETGLTRNELIGNKNILGIRNTILNIKNKMDKDKIDKTKEQKTQLDEYYKPILEKLESIVQKLKNKQKITESDINELKNFGERIGLVFNKHDGYVYCGFMDLGDEDIDNAGNIEELDLFCVDPTLDDDEQEKKAKRFVCGRFGLDTALQIAQIPIDDLMRNFGDLFGKAESNEDVAKSISEKIKKGWFLTVVGGILSIGTNAASGATEKYVLGPIRVWGNVLDLIPGGDEFSWKEVGIDYAEGIAPVMIFGLTKNLVTGNWKGLLSGKVLFESLAYPYTGGKALGKTIGKTLNKIWKHGFRPWIKDEVNPYTRFASQSNEVKSAFYSKKAKVLSFINYKLRQREIVIFPNIGFKLCGNLAPEQQKLSNLHDILNKLHNNKLFNNPTKWANEISKIIGDDSKELTEWWERNSLKIKKNNNNDAIKELEKIINNQENIILSIKKKFSFERAKESIEKGNYEKAKKLLSKSNEGKKLLSELGGEITLENSNNFKTKIDDSIKTIESNAHTESQESTKKGVTDGTEKQPEATTDTDQESKKNESDGTEHTEYKVSEEQKKLVDDVALIDEQIRDKIADADKRKTELTELSTAKGEKIPASELAEIDRELKISIEDINKRRTDLVSKMHPETITKHNVPKKVHDIPPGKLAKIKGLSKRVGKGIGGLLIGLGIAYGSGKVIEFFDKERKSVDLSQVYKPEELADQNKSKEDFKNNKESLKQTLEQMKSYATNFGAEAYNELNQTVAPEKLAKLPDEELINKVNEFAKKHIEKVEEFKKFLIVNRAAILAFYEENPSMQDKKLFNVLGLEGNGMEFLEVHYDKDSKQPIMEYADESDFKKGVYEYVDFTKAHLDDILAGKELTMWDTAKETGTYMIPGVGTYMDGRDAVRAMKRGEIGTALKSGAWCLFGAAGDVLTFVGIGTLVKATRIGAKAIEATAKGAETALRMARLSKLLNKAKSATSAINQSKTATAIIHHGTSSVATFSMMGADFARALIIPKRSAQFRF